MQNYSTWRIEPTKILTRRELACVLEDLHSRAERSQSARLNLIIFRLACCCGLRVSEIAGLKRDMRAADHAARGARGLVGDDVASSSVSC